MEKITLKKDSWILKLAFWGLFYRWKEIKSAIANPDDRKDGHDKLSSCLIGKGLLGCLLRICVEVLTAIICTCFYVVSVLYKIFITIFTEIVIISFGHYVALNRDFFQNYLFNWQEDPNHIYIYTRLIPAIHYHYISLRPIYAIIPVIFCYYGPLWVMPTSISVMLLLKVVDLLTDKKLQLTRKIGSMSTSRTIAQIYRSLRDRYCLPVELVD